MARHFITRLAPVVILLYLQGCSDPPVVHDNVSATAVDPIVRELRALRQLMAHDLRVKSADLVAATNQFLASPSTTSQQTLQRAWIEAHREYLALSLLLPDIHDQVHVWPVEPGFLDSVEGYPESGIVNDTTLDIDIETLWQQHGFTDPSEACLGFHPIEYYAFMRDVTDFANDDEIARRRRKLLEIMVTELDRMLNQASRPANDSGTPKDQLRRLLAQQQHGLAMALAAVDIDTKVVGFSQTEATALTGIVHIIRQLWREDGSLFILIQKMDPKAAAEITDTLSYLDREEQTSLALITFQHQLAPLVRRLTES